MALKDEVEQQMKTALKNKEKVRLSALRGIKSELLLLETSGQSSEISEEDEIAALKKLVKQHRESAEYYRKSGDEDSANEEEQKAQYIEAYLPEQMSDEDLDAEIKKIIEETGAESKKDMGKVMGIATKRLAGKADNNVIAEKVKAMLP